MKDIEQGAPALDQVVHLTDEVKEARQRAQKHMDDMGKGDDLGAVLAEETEGRVFVDPAGDVWLELEPGQFGMRVGGETWSDVRYWYDDGDGKLEGHDLEYIRRIGGGDPLVQIR